MFHDLTPKLKQNKKRFLQGALVILQSNLTSVDLQYFCGTSVVVRWWRLRMPSTCWDAFLLLWSCIICEMDPWTKHVLEGNRLKAMQRFGYSQFSTAFRMTNLLLIDWIWVGEPRQLRFLRMRWMGYFLSKPASKDTLSPSRSQCLVFCRTNVDCREAHVFSFRKLVEFPTPPRRKEEVSQCRRGNNLEDYLNRLGGTKVHNQLVGGSRWRDRLKTTQSFSSLLAIILFFPFFFLKRWQPAVAFGLETVI